MAANEQILDYEDGDGVTFFWDTAGFVKTYGPGRKGPSGGYQDDPSRKTGRHGGR